MKIAIRSLALVLAVGVSACTKSETQTPANDTTPAANETPKAPTDNAPVVEAPKVEAPVVETPAPVVASTSGPVGTWALDGAATFEANRATIEGSLGAAAEEEKAMVMNMMTEMFNAMSGTLTLNADNSLTGTMSMANPLTGEPDDTTMTGSWAASGEGYTITTREEGKDKDEVNSATIDGNTLNFVADESGQPMTLVFKRQG